MLPRPSISKQDIPKRDGRARTKAHKFANSGVVVRLFVRPYAKLLGEAYVLLRALSLEDLERWVSALRAHVESAPPDSEAG